MNKVVLLDRDGTVIVDPPDERVTSEADVELFPDSISALKKLKGHGFSVVLITDQAGIAEGRLSEEDFWRINKFVVDKLQTSGVKILKTFMCPHAPADNCVCRKPKPYMLNQAAKEFGLDIEQTFFAGDRRTDVLAGQAAGAKTILVKTANIPEEAPEANYQAANLTAAVDYILANS